MSWSAPPPVNFGVSCPPSIRIRVVVATPGSYVDGRLPTTIQFYFKKIKIEVLERKKII
jgi:hypothetical protein